MSAPGYSRTFVWIASGAVFAVAAFVGGWTTLFVSVLSSWSGDAVQVRPFDAPTWNRPDWKSSIGEASHYHSVRQEMVDDLLARFLHRGLSQEQVLALIGPKDPDPYFKEPDPQAWIYFLGLERGLGVDNEWLFVSFDEQGKVARAFLATD